MTEPLYLDASDQRSFTATVERALEDRVALNRTLFYPTGGGQPHDTGTLSIDERTWRVTDVQKKDTIYHTVTGDPPAEGAEVTGTINWDRRYAHMRYHTAQHLLSAVLLVDFEAETTGNQLYTDRARIDCAYPRFDEGDLEHVEARMNDLIADAMPVRWYTLDRDEAEDTLDPQRTRLDLLPASVTEVRIVEVDDFDRTACAGTHVANTDEIGRFSIEGRETKGADEERLTFSLDD